VETGTSPDGAVVSFLFAEGVQPRFYEITASSYVLDVDLAGSPLPMLTAADLAQTATDQQEPEAQPAAAQADTTALRAAAPTTVTPFINTVGDTVRVVFPFEQETPAAIF